MHENMFSISFNKCCARLPVYKILKALLDRRVWKVNSNCFVWNEYCMICSLFVCVGHALCLLRPVFVIYCCLCLTIKADFVLGLLLHDIIPDVTQFILAISPLEVMSIIYFVYDLGTGVWPKLAYITWPKNYTCMNALLLFSPERRCATWLAVQ